MKVSAHGAHAEPNKILAALATEPSAIKQYAQRTDHDIHLRNAAFLERGVTSYINKVIPRAYTPLFFSLNTARMFQHVNKIMLLVVSLNKQSAQD